VGLVDKDGVWYLLAGTDRGRRTFRVDRIVAAEPTDERFERPADFDLGTAWTDVVEELEGRRSRVWATVLVDPRHVPILADLFGRHCHEVGQDADGRARLRLGGSIPLDIARILAGWGNLVDVVEPPSVRDLLARLGSELVAAYA
jgi:predicted DNA-binding transcriptional regulator YafY